MRERPRRSLEPIGDAPYPVESERPRGLDFTRNSTDFSFRWRPQMAPSSMNKALPLLIALALFGTAGLFGSCAATDSGYGSTDGESQDDATPGRVTFIDYSDFIRLNLVNMAHSDPVEYYSEVRTTASTKITYNEVFTAMLDYFDDQGFSRVASPGFAPATGSRGAVQALEVETESGTRFLVYGEDADEEQRQTFRDCVIAWQQVFNRTQQSQAVSNTSGGTLFDNQKAKTNHLNR